ncbi:MAG: hypothetical protein K9L17_12980 [Clostridiales bacterium]|nr:hypothetical protein [Clostridiales bacterium]MCF8023593.1 hypothetical protein [Clostridiales bacterium]
MKKIVALLPEQEAFNKIDTELTEKDITNFRSIKVSDEYEEQVRQEIFLTAREGRITISSALAGALLGLILIAFLLSNNNLGQVLTPLLANTIYSTLFTGAGVGLAAGGLLGGLYALSRSLPREFTGYTMLVAYCTFKEAGEAKKVLKKYNGIFL